MKRAQTHRETASQVADTLFQTEAAIDGAMIQIANFTQALPAAGKAAGFSAVRGQKVYERLAEAMVAQSQVRALIVDVHGLLADLKDDSILRTAQIGGGSKDPPAGQAHLASATLSLVGATG